MPGLPGSVETPDERGSTIVEAAIAVPLVITLLFGIIEFGLLFKDWLTVGHAAREGARVAATLADDRFSNIAVLDTVEEKLGTVSINEAGVEVRIYDVVGGTSDTYTYAPGSTFCIGAGECCRWTPCPDPRYTVSQGFASDHYTVPNWAPASRDISAPTTDRVGVEVDYVHEWITGLIQSGTQDVTGTVEYQIEPQVFD